jgi:hypothetical protein
MAKRFDSGGLLTPDTGNPWRYICFCWAYLTSYPSPVGNLMEKGWANASDRTFVWDVNGSGQHTINTLNGDTGYGFSTPNALPLNQWVALQMCIDNDGASHLWTNGAYQGGVGWPAGSVNQNTFGIGIGRRYREGGTYPFPGYLAWCSYWNTSSVNTGLLAAGVLPTDPRVAPLDNLYFCYPPWGTAPPEASLAKYPGWNASNFTGPVPNAPTSPPLLNPYPAL